jgi:hypothetical protein
MGHHDLGFGHHDQSRNAGFHEYHHGNTGFRRHQFGHGFNHPNVVVRNVFVGGNPAFTPPSYGFQPPIPAYGFQPPIGQEAFFGNPINNDQQYQRDIDDAYNAGLNAGKNYAEDNNDSCKPNDRIREAFNQFLKYLNGADKEQDSNETPKCAENKATCEDNKDDISTKIDKLQKMLDSLKGMKQEKTEEGDLEAKIQELRDKTEKKTEKTETNIVVDKEIAALKQKMGTTDKCDKKEVDKPVCEPTAKDKVKHKQHLKVAKKEIPTCTDSKQTLDPRVQFISRHGGNLKYIEPNTKAINKLTNKIINNDGTVTLHFKRPDFETLVITLTKAEAKHFGISTKSAAQPAAAKPAELTPAQKTYTTYMGKAWENPSEKPVAQPKVEKPAEKRISFMDLDSY